MVSREVSTVPRPAPSRRTIAVPISPSSSTAKAEGEFGRAPSSNSIKCKDIKTKFSPFNDRVNGRDSVQATCSSVEVKRIYVVDDERKSRSQHELTNTDDYMKSKALELLNNLTLNFQTNKYIRNGLNSKNVDIDDNKSTASSKNNSKFVSCNNSNGFFDTSSKKYDESIDKTSLIISRCELDDKIFNWINKLNIGSDDSHGRRVEEETVLNNTCRQIKTLILSKVMSYSELKTDILNLFEVLPITISCDIETYVNKLLDNIFDKSSNTKAGNCVSNGNKRADELSQLTKNKMITLPESDIKVIVEEFVLNFLGKTNIHMDENKKLDIENDLVSLLVDSFDYIRLGNDNIVLEKVRKLFKDLGKFTNPEVLQMSKVLVHNLKNMLNEDDDDLDMEKHEDIDSIIPIDEGDLNSTVDQYTIQLMEKIDDWLTSLNLLQNQNKQRQLAVKDLAGEIVDRLNYLELNPNSRGNDIDELEQLKFQIFKWIKRLVGAGIIEILKHAQDLMNKIKSITVPMLANPQEDISRYQLGPASKKHIVSVQDKHFKGDNQNPFHRTKSFKETELKAFRFEENNEAGLSTLTYNNGKQNNFDQKTKLDLSGTAATPRLTDRARYQRHTSPTMHDQFITIPLNSFPNYQTSSGHTNSSKNNGYSLPPCCTGNDRSASVSLKEVNDEYNSYIKQWLLSIPMDATNPDEKKQAELARINVYNGIWKVITKLKFDPKTNENFYYYQDVLEDEIEDLLSKLPQTKELELEKERLKKQLIEKTLSMNEQIKAVAAPSHFKQRIIENLDNYLPKLNAREELTKHELVEDYILFARYKDNDDRRAIVYKKNFLKKIQQLADNVKTNLTDKFNNIDPESYMNELISAVSRVPAPDNDVLDGEANEIQILKEIDNWLTDLPLKMDINPIDKLRIRDALARQVSELSKDMNLYDCIARKELQKLLPKHLQKLTLNDDIDLNFVIEELFNRLKNVSNEYRRKSVSFQIPQSYHDFGRQMPGCSSFLETPEILENNSLTMLKENRNAEPRWNKHNEPTTSENEWLSMEQTRPPSGMLGWSRQQTTSNRTGYILKPYPPTKSRGFVNQSRDNSYAGQVPQTPISISMKDASTPRSQWNSNLHYTPGGNEISDNSQYIQRQQTTKALISTTDSRTSEQFPSSFNKDMKQVKSQSFQNSTKMRESHEFYLSTDSEGIRRIIEDNKRNIKSKKVNAESMTSPDDTGGLSSATDYNNVHLPQGNEFLCKHNSNCRQHIYTNRHRCRRIQDSDDSEYSSADDARCVCAGHHLKFRHPCYNSCEQSSVRHTLHRTVNMGRCIESRNTSTFYQDGEGVNTLPDIKSNVNLTSTKAEFIVTKSKSNEEISTTSIREESDRISCLYKRPDSQLLEEKIKAELCGKKLHKLALKLNDPKEKEKFKSKIKRYLQNSPNIFGDDNEKKELMRQLPDRLVNRLKKVLLKSPLTGTGVNRSKIPAHYSKCKVENLSIVLKNWFKKCIIKEKECIGTTKNKERLINYMLELLEPLVLDRPENDSEYRISLKTNLVKLFSESPAIVRNAKEEHCLDSIIDTLVNDIMNISANIPVSYIQPTIAEIKRFIEDEISFFLEKSHVNISTKRFKLLKSEVTDILLDLRDIKDVNSNVINDISNMFENIMKLPAEEANYFSKILLNAYKEFFFRQSYFKHKENKQFTRHAACPTVQKANLTTTNNISIEGYAKHVKKEVEKWFENFNAEIEDSNFKDIVIKNIVNDILDRCKYLLNGKENTSGELEVLKYLIFKRTHKLLGLSSNKIIKHVSKLIEKMQQLPTPSTFNEVNDRVKCEATASHGKSKLCLAKVIHQWFRALPIDTHSSEDNFNILVNNLTEAIEKAFTKENHENIDECINEWILKTFDKKLDSNFVQDLKDKILLCTGNSLVFSKNNLEQADLMLNFENIISKWIRNVHFKSLEEIVVNSKNEYIHELATILYNTYLLNQSSAVDITEKFQQKILKWMKNLPNSQQTDKNHETKYTLLLAKTIAHYIKSRNILFNKTDTVMFDCLVNQRTTKNLTKTKTSQESILINDIASRRVGNSLDKSVENWLNKLPIQIKDSKYFEVKKRKFIENIKVLRAVDASDDVIVEEILQFMKTLPLEEVEHQDKKLLDGRINNLNLDSNILKVVSNIIKKWASKLPINPVYDPASIKSLIDEMSSALVHQLRHLEKDDSQLKEEIMKFLKRFPFKLEYSSKHIFSKLADLLALKLRGIETKGIRTDLTIYGVPENSFPYDENAKTNLTSYTTKVVNEISDWLNSLSLVKNKDECFKIVIMNDLANDIIDRQAYLELNPEHRDYPEKEIEQLKFQIYKSVNKLVDQQWIDNTHVEDLLNRVHNIPARMSTKTQVWQAKTVTEKSENNINTEHNTSNLDATNGNLSQDHNRTLNNQKKMDAIFDKYKMIFLNKVNDLPTDASTSSSAQLNDRTKIGIYNGIIKTFFSLKSDQEIENDYEYFELTLEDKLDEMLDVLPQTEALRSIRHSWKLDIVSNAIDMLREMQEVTDPLSFRQRIKEGFNRKFARNLQLEECYLLQQGFLSEMADAYVLETKYKAEDPIKAKIYKQRLMNKINEMVNHLTRQHNVEFRLLKRPLLVQQAMKVLEEVPIPKDDVLNEEVEEILMAEDIEQWYKELPVSPYMNDFDQVFRKRMMQLLAKKLHDIDKQEDNLDKSKEIQKRHEISKFLTERGRLEDNQDLNINFMVDALNNRLKKSRAQGVIGYDTFKSKNPISSTFAKLDNTDILSSLIDINTNTDEVNSEEREMRDHDVVNGNGSQIRPSQGFIKQPNFLHHSSSTDQMAANTCYPDSNVPYQWPAKTSGYNNPQNNLEVRRPAGHLEYTLKPGVPMRIIVRPPVPGSYTKSLGNNQGFSEPTQNTEACFGDIGVNTNQSMSQTQDSHRRSTSSRCTRNPHRIKYGCKRPSCSSPHRGLMDPRFSSKKNNSEAPISTCGHRRPRLNRPNAFYDVTENVSASNHPDVILEDSNAGFPRRTCALRRDDTQENKPIIINCKCMEGNVRRRFCLDSYPCPCSIIVSPCRFYC